MLKIIENFITEEQEREILKLVSVEEINETEGRNRIFRYGAKKVYGKYHLSNDIPEVFNQFKKHFKFDNVTINEYLKDQSIAWHIDVPKAGKEIVVLSLLGNATLKFRRLGEEITYELPPRSLVTFSGELRYSWQHSVTAHEKRYSIVFRNTNA
jgi:hypothetical protein